MLSIALLLHQSPRNPFKGGRLLKIKLQTNIHGIRLVAARPRLQRVMQVGAEAWLPLYGDPQAYQDAIGSDARPMNSKDTAIAVGQA